jgi:hypothetical protein
MLVKILDEIPNGKGQFVLSWHRWKIILKCVQKWDESTPRLSVIILLTRFVWIARSDLYSRYTCVHLPSDVPTKTWYPFLKWGTP